VTSPLFRGPSATRRTLFKTAGKASAVLAAAALSLSACSTGPAAGPAASTPDAGTSSSSQFPVTIKHVFGETTIKERPTRVATVSWVNDDVAIALGVVPVGVPKNEWGGNEQGSTPWKDAALKELGAGFGTAKAPVQYSEADGINFTEIAKLTPDVILAAYSGLSEEDYRKLSEIAPVVVHPEVAYGTSWQDSTAIIGKALGKDAEATKLISATEATVKNEAAKYPQIAGKSFIYGYANPADPTATGFYTANDNRPRFLSAIGMTLAPVAEKASAGSKEFFVPWSA
jgi:iron complex transport system substrate-binding protein